MVQDAIFPTRVLDPSDSFVRKQSWYWGFLLINFVGIFFLVCQTSSLDDMTSLLFSFFSLKYPL